MGDEEYPVAFNALARPTCKNKGKYDGNPVPRLVPMPGEWLGILNRSRPGVLGLLPDIARI